MTPRYGYRDALREAIVRDPEGFALALLATPCVVLVVWFVTGVVLAAGQS